MANTKPFYIYANYNVKCYSTNPLTPTKKNAPARIVNALINAINDNKYLPRLIVIIPYWDIVNFVGPARFGIFDILESLMRWIVTAMNTAIDTRIDDLQLYNQGATTYGKPKWLWVKMIDRVSVVDKVLASRGKFNRALENMIAGRCSHYLIDINKKIGDSAYFNAELKSLNADGRGRYWMEIDKIVKYFDFQDPRTCKELKPKSKSKNKIVCKCSFNKIAEAKLKNYVKNNSW